METIKILMFGDLSAGAMGIINRDIKRIIDESYQNIYFDLVDWGDIDKYSWFFNEQNWKNYDLIIIDPHMAYVCDSGWYFPLEDQALFKSKLIPVYHCELDIDSEHFNHGWHDGWFTRPVCGINGYITNQIRKKGADAQMLPIGVNGDKFKPYKKVKEIKRAGFVGDNPKEDWKYIKRPEMFMDICKLANIEPVIISGREHGPKMYEDVDIVICCSRAEGLPTYFAEVAACKIPFISTDVGIVRDYYKVKKFNTAEEAVGHIKYFNTSEYNIKEYTDTLYGEMFPDKNWRNILEKYWIPYFRKLYKLNNSKS